jgi:large repetitive protein
VFRWSPEPSEPPAIPASDTDPPDTVLRSVVKRHGHRAKHSFDSTEPGSSFVCRLDGRDAETCSSPVRYSHLGFGRHRVRVVAVDAAGNADPIAAVRRWHARKRMR